MKTAIFAATALAALTAFVNPSLAEQCQDVTTLEVKLELMGNGERMGSFRAVAKDRTRPLRGTITIGRVDPPLLLQSPSLSVNIVANGRMNWMTFARTSDLLTPLPTYLPVYDRPASTAAFEVGIEGCSTN